MQQFSKAKISQVSGEAAAEANLGRVKRARSNLIGKAVQYPAAASAIREITRRSEAI
jgi:hypothetical protein